jgi:DNA-binding FadR family transcriptional regulator
MNKDNSIKFSEYKYRRASLDIAELIRKAIISEQFKSGDRLPAERELASQFQVGRMTIREALRTLETRGLITIRKGGSGGAFVQPAPVSQVAEIIVDNMEMEKITVSEILESRVLLECSIIPTVVENATPEDMNGLRNNIEETRQMVEGVSPMATGEYITKLIDFHRLLVQSAHLGPISIMHAALVGWAFRRLKYWHPSKAQRKHVFIAHQKIFDALEKKEIERCQKELKNHLREVYDGIEDKMSPKGPTSG